MMPFLAVMNAIKSAMASSGLLKNLEIGSLLVFLRWDLGGRDVVGGR
jgi:hypothetical protein